MKKTGKMLQKLDFQNEFQIFINKVEDYIPKCEKDSLFLSSLSKCKAT